MPTVSQSAFELDEAIASVQDPLHNAESVPASSEYFRVGTPLQLSAQVKNNTVKQDSVLLGFRLGRFLLVELPTVDGRAMVIASGSEVRVRYLIDGRLLGFACEVLKVQFNPEKLVFLKYPRKVDQLALRRHERVRVNIQCLVRIGSDPSQVGAEAHDLSVSGCGILFPPNVEGLKKGVRLTVYFRIPGDEALYKGRAWTRLVKKRRDGLWVGCEFDFRPGEEETKTMVERMVLARTGGIATSDFGSDE